MHARFPAALTCTCTRARTNRHHRPPAHTPAENLNPVRPHSHPRSAARPPCICSRTCAGTYARRAGRSAPARRAVLHLHAARAGQHMHARLPAALTCTCSCTRGSLNPDIGGRYGKEARQARTSGRTYMHLLSHSRSHVQASSSSRTRARTCTRMSGRATRSGMGSSQGRRIRSGWEDQSGLEELR